MAYAPNLPTAITLLLLRVVLSQMDVPTRQGVRHGPGRPGGTHRGGVGDQHRLLSRPPIGPLLAGTVQTVGLGAPFVLAGTIKSIYDLVLSRWFRTVPLPEQIPP